MANPSLKKGFFSIATELAQQLAKHNIPGEEMRIIWAVWLKTWAWKKGTRRKDSDWISYSQLEEITNIKRSNCATLVKSLLSKSILLRDGNALKFNQNYDLWVLSKRITPLSKSITPVMQKHNSRVLSKSIHTKENTVKETITKEFPPLKTAEYQDEVNLIFNAFYETINPQIAFARKDSRDAALWLINKYGFENTLKAAKYACLIFAENYAPQIKTPAELKDKWANLVKFKNQQDNGPER